ncbi:phage portal protein [Leifsonia sp. NPDC056824]|uniref:phage portal protein n=1 Tax=Leifsonia sp. NPDC056824 TaxID=3345953 RepID=UPI003691C251
MSLFVRRGLGDTPYNLIPSRQPERTGAVQVSADTALRASAVWAAVRLRADVLSTLPVHVLRKVGDMDVEVPAPPVILNPGGDEVGMNEFLYSTQVDLDRIGNTYGIISELDALGKPRRVDLVDANTVVVLIDKTTGDYTYRIGGKPYTKDQVWHERQFTVSGMVMGLSPIMYAAWTIGQYQSAVDFGLDWFANGGTVPGGILKNSARTLGAGVAEAAKRKFKESVRGRDLFVTGNDWEYSTVNVAQNESQFLDTQKLTSTDIARFFGVPADMIDVAPVGKQALTYANVTQRNLQFLIMNLGPALVRREVALSKWLPAPRFVKFDTDHLLRMDPDTRNDMLLAQVAGMIRTPSEVRAKDNLPPFTPAQIEEFKQLGISHRPAPPDPQPVGANVPGADEGAIQ